jgi:hypothetical protein
MQLGAAEQSPVLQRLRSIAKSPVFSLMLALRSDDVAAMPFDAASVSGSAAIQWVSRDSSKPGRGLFLAASPHSYLKSSRVPMLMLAF